MRELKLNYLVVFLAASAVIIFFDSQHLLDPIRSVAQDAAAPVTFAGYQLKLSLADFFSFATFWKSGEARIKNLEQRNLELVVDESKLKDLERENAALRQQLGVTTLPAKQLLPVTVLGNGQYLEIGAGRKDGVQEGQIVVYLGNLVGRIASMADHESFVELPTDSQAKIPVKIGQVSGLAVGQFNSAITLDRVAQNEQISEGDLVTTSGEGGTYSPGLVVGRITKIVSAETDLFKRAEVVPLVDYSTLSTVFVILN